MVSKCEWAEYINKEDPSVRRRPSSVVSIFRVPYFLKSIKEEAYVPQRVSLGPHHYGCAELPAMGHHKGRALRGMMKRCKVNIRNNMDFANAAMGEILKLESEIRDQYEENIDYNGEDLARMLCLDGCFILQVLRTLARGNGPPVAEESWECYDPIFGRNKLEFAASDILNDILMLENQMPFFVLRRLLELELNSAVGADKMLLDVLKKIPSWLFNPFGDGKEDSNQWSWPNPHEVQHLLGVLHTLIASPPTSSVASEGQCSIPIGCCCSRKWIIKLQDKNIESTESTPNATELRNAGITFKKCEGGIKGIRFEQESATIFLPPLCVMNRTEIIFRNLIAYEMCKPYEVNFYVSSYVNLMDDLIDSEEDVALLKRMGVLKNLLGSDKEVADLFNALCKGVTLSMEDVFDKLTYKVNEHYKNIFKVQFAGFMREYFSSPWKALAWAAAIVGLLLTVVQTIWAIIFK